ncbi:uncharacterized protein DNG_03763 [Cephalotrichum gorgonifer]|uniref:Saccharopine dehydrogenase NADP binding domain-containing protein n=1 Tax=Cephalotrichum gorgonifer TaxID=2041049 RepID=A0AAE8MUS0_9PEZI|nr:uncharacterized protein DNG_03763 [Cephalotrichum gorgonifer]
MPIKEHDRQYDLVVWGATGYTGKRVAQHIAAHFPTDLKWALAGRTEPKLRALLKQCAEAAPDRRQPDIQVCNLDRDELAALAKTTRVLISCVGPFAKYGEMAYAACAEQGTSYLDITGEFPFTVAMVKKYEAAAKASGALMIGQAAIESAPPDLLTWCLSKKAREAGGVGLGDVTVVMDIHSRPSGGTLASVIGLFDSYSPSQLISSAAPYANSPVPNPSRRRRPTSLLTRLTGLRTIPHLGLATTSLTHRADGCIVERTWGLLQTVPSLRGNEYGKRFTWDQHMAAPSALGGAVVHIVLAVAGVLLFFPPVRWLAKRLVCEPGDGPDEESSRDDVVRYRGVAAIDGGGGKEVYCEGVFRGSMYIFSAVLVCQAALTLLEDDLDLPGGCYTPACLGQGYIDRLGRHGFPIEGRIIDETNVVVS